jgi:hypothetical protein
MKIQHELEGAAGRIGAVREVAVVAGPDRENPQGIERRAERDRLPRDPGPEDRETAQVHQHERDRVEIEDVAAPGTRFSVVRHRDGSNFRLLSDAGRGVATHPTDQECVNQMS